MGDSLQVQGDGSIGDPAGDLTVLIVQAGSVDFDGNLAIAHADAEMIRALSSLAVGSIMEDCSSTAAAS